MTATTEHALPLAGGRMLRVTITETADVVYFNIHGDRVKRREWQALADFMGPLLRPYDADPRPLELDGPRAPCAVRINDIAPSLTAICRVDRAKGRA